MLDFLYTAVSWVLLRWHQLFTAIGIDKDSGLNWSLSIVFLVITARVLLFRVFIRQVKTQRRMQEMQPKMQAIREKYKNDKAEQQRQMMKLQQEEGFNPISGCLPMFLQFPIFIGLLHVLRHLSAAASTSYQQAHPDRLTLYGFTKDQTLSAAKAKAFGAPLAAQLRDSADQIHLLGGEVTITRIVIVILVVISACATYTTQRLVKASATTTPVGTAATMQKLMLYVIPLFTLGSGLFFPLGVLLYWFVSNTWTMGQQFYINKYHPHVPNEPTTSGELGRTLAPKPGQRPNLSKADRRVSSANGAVPNEDDAPADEPTGATDASPRQVTPRPGQRPNRQPGSKRPTGKRPSQAKKRR